MGYNAKRIDAYVHTEDVFILIFKAREFGLKNFIVLKNENVKKVLNEAASHGKLGIGYDNRYIY